MSSTVLVIDDEEGQRQGWARAIGSRLQADGQWEVVPPDIPTLVEALKILEARRIEARGDARVTTERTPFDDADVVVVDYDLAPISALGSLNGEAVAYLVRAYSTAGFIMLLNPKSDSFFDLTLRGDGDSFADLIVGGRHVASRGLWSEIVDGFRPWHWPVVPRATDTQRAFAEHLQDKLNVPLINALELEGLSLSRDVRAWVGGSASAGEVTIREFVEDSPNGLRRKDAARADADVARIAAARLLRWLEYDVLSSQDVLIDAPHLAGRFPSLVEGPLGEIETWNAIAHPGKASGIRADVLAEHRYGLSDFLSREVWVWPLVKADKRIAEVASPLLPREAPFLFCEDVSRFLPPDSVQEFVSAVAGDFVRRYAVDVDSEAGAQYAEDLEGVDLIPLSRLTGA